MTATNPAEQSFGPAALDPLSDVEKRLVEAARAGTELVCSDLTAAQLTGNTDMNHVVRAELIRELLLGRHGDLDPRGVQITGARLTGTFDLRYVHSTVGLHLIKCAAEQALRVTDAHLPRLHLIACDVPRIHGDGLQVDGDVFLRRSTAAGDDKTGTIRLPGAHISGQLSLTGTHITNPNGPALHADGLRVDGDVFLDKGFTAVGSNKAGAIRLFGANISGQLNLTNAHITNPNGPAFQADGLQVVDLLSNGEFAGSGEDGAIRLLSARISGTLTLRKAHITNPNGPALQASRLRVDGDAFLDEGFTAAGVDKTGSIWLLGAHISGQLSLTGAHVTNPDGPALTADRIRVESTVFLDEGFTAAGGNKTGATRLPGAHIDGQLVLTGAHITNPDRLVLDLRDARTTSLTLPATVVCPSGARTMNMCSTPDRRIDVDGLVYTSIDDMSWRQWLHLLRRHTAGYQPMPYQQLAAVQKATGHDRDARSVLIAQQKDLQARGQIGGWFAKTVHWLWGALAGYGYRAGRTALALLIVLALAGGTGWWAGHTVTSPGQHAAQHTKSSTQPGTACSPLEQIGLGIDRGLPLGSTGIRTYCDLNTASPAGEWFTLAIWVLQAMIWALATLAIAGYTGLIRKIT